MSTQPTATAEPVAAGKGTYECRSCGATWGGMNTCHCDGCHHTFTGITTFDQHRRGGACKTPADAGLVLTSRTYPCFGAAGSASGEQWWKADSAEVTP